MTSTDPTTEAGKRLLAREDLNSRSFALIRPEDILAIEAEARARPAVALVEAAEEVWKQHRPRDPDLCWRSLRAALDA